jgi:hypothetical protein
MLSKNELRIRERKALDEMYDAMRSAGPHSEAYWNKKLAVVKIQSAINK